MHDKKKLALHSPLDGRSEGLQQLRFWAALFVLVHHALEECSINPDLPFPKWLIMSGASGVDIFFVISGYVIWQTTEKSVTSTPTDFIKRRLLRILPLYWACLSVVLFLWACNLAFKSAQVSTPTLISSLFLLPPVTDKGLVIGVAWTLVYELYFYFVFAIALLSKIQKRRFFIILFFILTIPYFLELFEAKKYAEYYRNPIVAEFIFGCFIARYARIASSLKLGWTAYFFGIICLLLVSQHFFSNDTAGLPTETRWWAWGLPAALILSACATGDGIQCNGPTKKYLNILGDASYALYLTHGFVMIGLAKLLKNSAFNSVWATLLAGIAAVLLSIILSYIIYQRIERPTMNWLTNRFLTKRNLAPNIL